MHDWVARQTSSILMLSDITAAQNLGKKAREEERGGQRRRHTYNKFIKLKAGTYIHAHTLSKPGCTPDKQKLSGPVSSFQRHTVTLMSANALLTADTNPIGFQYFPLSFVLTSDQNLQ